MSLFRDIARQALTEADNETADLFRILACVGVAAYVVFSGVALGIHPDSWNPINYGTGLAACLAGAGAALRLRDGLPPESQPPAAGPTTVVQSKNTEINQ